MFSLADHTVCSLSKKQSSLDLPPQEAVLIPCSGVTRSSFGFMLLEGLALLQFLAQHKQLGERTYGEAAGAAGFPIEPQHPPKARSRWKHTSFTGSALPGSLGARDSLQPADLGVPSLQSEQVTHLSIRASLDFLLSSSPPQWHLSLLPKHMGLTQHNYIQASLFCGSRLAHQKAGPRSLH